MAAKYLRVDRRITWDGESCRIVSPSHFIEVAVIKRPADGYGFLLASHPSNHRRDIRFYVDRTSGLISGGSADIQQVVSGTYLQLFPDYKNPRPEEWVVELTPVTVLEGE